MIFLDVGAYEGQTLEEVTKPEYGFALILAFEPVREQFLELARRWADHPRVILYNVGLHEETGTRRVYGDNDRMEASTFADKIDVDESRSRECDFIAAGEFMASVVTNDQFVVKLNCEGCEIAVLDSLIDSNQIERCRHILIDFDVRKVPGMEGEEARILGRLAEIEFDRFSIASEVMIGRTHQERTAAWLRVALS